MTFRRLCKTIERYCDLTHNCPINVLDLDNSKYKCYASEEDCTFEDCREVIKKEITEALIGEIKKCMD